MQNLCCKNILIILAILFTINFINAVPQIIIAETNVTIFSNQTGNMTSGNFHMLGEGGELRQGFNVQGMCNFTLNIDKIPLRFSREFVENQTDMAVLIHALTISNNVTADLIKCNNNLSICMNDIGYKANYTQCDIQLTMCRANENKLSKDAADYKEQADKYKTWMYIGCFFGIAGLIAAWNFRKKSMVKITKSPMDSLPGSVKL